MDQSTTTTIDRANPINGAVLDPASQLGDGVVTMVPSEGAGHSTLLVRFRPRRAVPGFAGRPRSGPRLRSPR